MAGSSELESQRLDKWLWSARFFKTRSAAAAAIGGGNVQVDGQRVKPSKRIRVNMTVSVRRGDTSWEVRIEGIARTRGPAREAIALYDELPHSIANRAREAAARREAAEVRAIRAGRPTKRVRRRLERQLESFREEPPG